MPFDPSTARLADEIGPGATRPAGKFDPSTAQEYYDPTEGMSGPDRVRAGIGKAFVGLGLGAKQLVGAAGPEEAAEFRRVNAPLMATTGGKVGDFLGNAAVALPTALVPGANTVAGAGVIGSALGLLQPAESGRQRVTQGAAGLVGGAVGQKVGQVAAQRLPGLIARRTAVATERQAENAVRDATIAEARKAGYVLPPATINQASGKAIAIEGFSGKAATQQSAAYRNQRVTNRLLREDLGLKGARQTAPAELATVRKEAGKVYEDVSRSGTIKADPQYGQELTDLSTVMDDVAAAFPGAKAPSGEQIRELTESLSQAEFPSSAAVKYVRNLREQAKSNFTAAATAGGDAEKSALAHAQWEAAGTLEDMVLRHLRSQGKDALADSFDKARTLIAKSYDAEAALNPGTGNFDPTKLVGKLRKNKPMSGGFGTAARFASAFRESAREQSTGPGVSALSAMLSTAGGIGGLAFGNPPAAAALASIPLSRMAARGTILSAAGQRLARPSYSPGNNTLALMNALAPLSAPVGISLANAE